MPVVARERGLAQPERYVEGREPKIGVSAGKPYGPLLDMSPSYKETQTLIIFLLAFILGLKWPTSILGVSARLIWALPPCEKTVVKFYFGWDHSARPFCRVFHFKAVAGFGSVRKQGPGDPPNQRSIGSNI